MILITGSAGYIGSELCKFFEEKKINYIGIDNLKYSYRSNIYNTKNFIKSCISNEKKISKIIKKYKISTIIHAAAFAYVNDAEENKTKYKINNVTKTKKFIKITINNGIKNFIFLSSSNVYSENVRLFDEGSKTSPKNFYGKNKLTIEKFLLNKKNKYTNLLILRLFNVIGLTKKFKPKNFGNYKHQRFLFKVFYNIKKKLPLEINYIKKIKRKMIFPSRDFVDIRDLCNLIFLIKKLFNSKNLYNIFNVGRGKSYSLDVILSMVVGKKNKLLINYNKISKKEYVFTKSIVGKAKKFYNWRPSISLKKSINSNIKNLII